MLRIVATLSHKGRGEEEPHTPSNCNRASRA
jgi:hypothetical protein